MNSSAIPRSRRSSSRIAITSACVVTSSAVVGSSASSSRGSVSSIVGDHHALQQAARELVRVLAEPALAVGDADVGQRLDGAPSRGGRGPRRATVPQRLGHEVADRPHRVDVRARVLEDHRDLRRGSRAAPPPLSAPTSRAVEADRAGGRRARRQQPADRAGGHRLARAGLADQADGLAGADRERDVVQHGPHARPRRAAGPRGARPRAAASLMRAPQALRAGASERPGPDRARARRRRGTASRRRRCGPAICRPVGTPLSAKPDGTLSTGQRDMMLNTGRQERAEVASSSTPADGRARADVVLAGDEPARADRRDTAARRSRSSSAPTGAYSSASSACFSISVPPSASRREASRANSAA